MGSLDNGQWKVQWLSVSPTRWNHTVTCMASDTRNKQWASNHTPSLKWHTVFCHFRKIYFPPFYAFLLLKIKLWSSSRQQWIIALVPAPEDPASIPNTNRVDFQCPHGSNILVWRPWALCSCGTRAQTQMEHADETPVCINKMKSFKLYLPL